MILRMQCDHTKACVLALASPGKDCLPPGEPSRVRSDHGTLAAAGVWAAACCRQLKLQQLHKAQMSHATAPAGAPALRVPLPSSVGRPPESLEAAPPPKAGGEVAAAEDAAAASLPLLLLLLLTPPLSESGPAAAAAEAEWPP